MTPCTAGNKCPQGSSALTQCPSGEYQQYTLQYACTTCPSSFYCSQTDTSTKTLCPSGQYCTSGQESATNCAAGTYNPRSGAGASSDCENCPYGSYCGSAGMSTSGSDCQSGYYCTRGASTATQNACPAGYYCPSGTHAPIPCPAGTYNTLTGKALLSDCVDCDVGKYCPDSGQSSQVSYNCAAGYYCISGARTARPTDNVTGRLCNAGYYCTSGTTSETLCPAGSYNPYSGLSTCLNCPAGYY